MTTITITISREQLDQLTDNLVAWIDTSDRRTFDLTVRSDGTITLNDEDVLTP